MTKAFLKIALCAGLMMLPRVGPGQTERSLSGISSGQSMSAKHLSATGRTSDPCVPASKLVGATVNDRSGNRVGELQDIIVDPRTGRIDFALVSLNGMPTNA